MFHEGDQHDQHLNPAHLVVTFFTASGMPQNRLGISSSKSAWLKRSLQESDLPLFCRIYHGFHHGFIKHISRNYPESLKLSNWDPNGIHSQLECCSSVDIHFLCWHCHKSHCELQSKNGLCCKALFASLLVNSPGRWSAQKYQDKTQPGSMANKNTTFCCNDETPATPLVAPTTLSFRMTGWISSHLQ